jgi:hypothetical protein
MDFSQFLKNSYSTKNTSKSTSTTLPTTLPTSVGDGRGSVIRGTLPNGVEDNEDNEDNGGDKNQNQIKNTTDSINAPQSNLNIYKNIRKGNMVKIKKLDNSELNYYKGYIGEVRYYKKDQTQALIFLHARNNNVVISFPLTHLELL